MIKRYLPCDKDTALGFRVSAKMSLLIIKKTGLLAIALPKPF
jgi:hypothetical protein